MGIRTLDPIYLLISVDKVYRYGNMYTWKSRTQLGEMR